MKTKKIIYFAYGGGHINMVLPLYKKLKTDTSYEQAIFALTTSQAKLKAENIPFISYRDFLYLDERAKKYGEELVNMQPNSAMIEHEESVAYLGFGFLDLVNKYGEEAAYKLYKEQGRFCFFPTDIMNQILTILKPDIVVATNSPRSERAALVAAKKLNIASICMSDLFDRKDTLPIAQFDLGSKVSVINEYAKNLLIEMGRSSNDIIITGNCAFDRIYDSSFIEKAVQYKEKHKLLGQTTILWARSALAEDIKLSDQIEEALINLALRSPKISVIIRPHPNDAIKQLPLTAPNIILSEKSDDIYTLVHSSDIIYTLYSTVGLEAAFVGKQVLQQTNTRIFSGFNLVDLGYAYGIDDLNQLDLVIAQILSAKTPKNSNSNGQIVNATDNICALIKELVR
jgi:hypothetical protein